MLRPLLPVSHRQHDQPEAVAGERSYGRLLCQNRQRCQQPGQRKPELPAADASAGEGPETGGKRTEHQDLGVGVRLQEGVSESDAEEERRQQCLAISEQDAGGVPDEGHGGSSPQCRQQSRRDDSFTQQLEGGNVPEEEHWPLVVPQVAVGYCSLHPAAGDDAVQPLVPFEGSVEERHEEEHRQCRDGNQEGRKEELSSTLRTRETIHRRRQSRHRFLSDYRRFRFVTSQLREPGTAGQGANAPFLHGTIKLTRPVTGG